jgi:hypothetical protein
MDFTWTILSIFEECKSIQYLITGTNGINTIESQGNHIFSNGVVNKPFNEIKEQDIIQWLEKDTTQDDVNPIKLALENQLKSLETTQKVDFPWLAGTFTIE